MPRHTETAQQVALALADGAVHSGEQLAQELGVSRGAVWKQVRRLELLGLEVLSVPGRGYRLAAPLDLLDAAHIRGRLSPEHAGRLHALSVLEQVDSTNTWLAQHAPKVPAVCLAERQTAGRGRRGRPWVSPYAANLYLSLGWQFDDLPPGFSALAMVAAVAVVRALRLLGLEGARIKWPNDLYASGKKLAGILVDLQGETPTRVRTVIGIGLNVRMPAAARNGIDQAWTDLASEMAGRVPGRNALAAAVIEALMPVLDQFAAEGFAAFADEWRALDLVAGHKVELHQHNGVTAGTAMGVDADGALLLHTAEGTRRYVSGDVSLRLAS